MSHPVLLPAPLLLLGGLPRGVCLQGDVGQTPPLFFPGVMYLLIIRITEAFGLLKPSLFSNCKVMLLLCHLRVN